MSGGGAGGVVVVLGLRSAQHVFDEVVAEYMARRGFNSPPQIFSGTSIGAKEFGFKRITQ